MDRSRTALVRLVRAALVAAEHETRSMPAADVLRIRVAEAATRSRVAIEAPDDPGRWTNATDCWRHVAEIAGARPRSANPDAARVATIARILAGTQLDHTDDELEARLAALGLIATLTMTDLDDLDMPTADPTQTGKRRIVATHARPA